MGAAKSSYTVPVLRFWGLQFCGLWRAFGPDSPQSDALDAVFYDLHGAAHPFVRDGEELDSERDAMERLIAEPTPAQSDRQTKHVEEGATGAPLINGTPPAGPVAIARFLDRTIG